MTQAKIRMATALSVATMALALGGCQALGIGGHGLARGSAHAERTAIAEFGAGQLEEGRQALKDGRTVDAIDAFMLAKSFEEQAPAAYNGLAVAYSRLGREDLTERFFQMAIALAPEDDRFRSNLAVFYSRNGAVRSNGPALAFSEVAPLVDDIPVETVAMIDAALPVVPEARSLGGGVSVRAPASYLRRVSSSEVRIASGRAATPTLASAGGHRAVIEIGRSAERAPSGARVAVITKSRGQPAYPIRIRLDD